MMKRTNRKKESRGLPGGPHEQFSYVTGVFSQDMYHGNISKDGYKRNSPDVNKPNNIIMGDPSGTPITMGGVDFAVKGVDNLGNEKIMYPGGEYHFPGSMVYETPFRRAQEGNGEKEVQQIYDFNGSKWKIKDGVYEQVSDDAPVTNAHTIDRSSAYAKNKSERLFRNITPQGYGDLKTNLERYKRYKGDLGRDKEDVLWQSAKDSPTGKPIYYNLPKRDDMFRLYLGLNQEHNSFTPQLDYKPSKAKNPDALYWKPNYWDDEMKQYLLDYSLNPIGLRDNKLVYDNKIFNERSDVFLPKLESLEAEGIDWSDPQTAEWVADNPLGDFTVTKGEDDHGKYISIYDKIDFNPFQTGDGSSTNAAGKALQLYMKSQGYDVDENTEAASLLGAGKPYEIYDRIYYDDKTGKIIKSAYETYGLTDDENSVGLTQLRWLEVKGEPALLRKLNKLGIKSNKDLMDPEKAALATIARLAFLINNRKGVDKNDLMNTLPGHWGGSSKDNKRTYINNVKKNSSYITVLQKQKGGEITSLYKEYMDGKNISSPARKAYDKLNRMYYTDAKQQGMSPANYIMTHVIGSK